MATLSTTDMLSNGRISWKVRTSPAAATRCAGHPVMSVPSNTTRPSLGGSWPETSENSVVLPAPLGPMMPRNSPSLDVEVDVLDGRQPGEATW